MGAPKLPPDSWVTQKYQRCPNLPIYNHWLGTSSIQNNVPKCSNKYDYTSQLFIPIITNHLIFRYGSFEKVQIDPTQMTDVQLIFPPRLLFKNYPYCYQHIPIESNWQVVCTRFTNTHQLLITLISLSRNSKLIPTCCYIKKSSQSQWSTPFFDDSPKSYNHQNFSIYSNISQLHFLSQTFLPPHKLSSNRSRHGTRRRPEASGSATSARQARSFRRTSG